MKKVSLKDIAKLAGVSPSTVSFVLNGKAKAMRITQSVADRVMLVAKQNGYTPNQVAVSLRTGQSRILGLLVEDISNYFFATLAKIIESEAEQFGYKVVYCSTENDPQKGQELLRMLTQHQVDGYLITPSAGMESDIANLVKLHKPVVLMDRYLPDLNVPYVMVDNYKGVVEGIEFLFDKGYSRIGYVTIDLDMVQIRQRLEAYTSVLEKHQIPFEEKYVLQLPYHYDRNEAVAVVTAFLKTHPELDAVFFSTNYLGIIGLESIARAGLHMPADIVMMCFDDHDIFRIYPDGITIIQQPIEQIAQTAIQLLMSELGKSAPGSAVEINRQVQLPAVLISRGVQ